jgi:hypothetical protein
MEEEWRAEDSGEESESSSDDSSDGEDEDWNDEMSSPPKKRQSSGKGRGKQSAQSSVRICCVVKLYCRFEDSYDD